MSKLFEFVNLDSSTLEINGIERAVALGMMDGVHLGHQKLIETITSFCEQENKQRNKIIPCAMTFREPPIKWTSKETKVELITTLEERLLLFKQYGIQQAIVFDFEEVSKLKAADYLNKVLKEQLNARFITCGENHNFGSKKEGCTKLLKEWGLRNNIKVEVCDLLLRNPQFDKEEIERELKISSSLIRNLLKEAKLKKASELLGHDFMVYGKVIPGKQLGTKLGFPTLNIEYHPDKVQVPYGVYAARTKINNKFYKSAVNLGFAPTVSSERVQPVLESYLLDFDDECLDVQENLLVRLLEFIRPEKKFDSFDDLKKQVDSDVREIQFKDLS